MSYRNAKVKWLTSAHASVSRNAKSDKVARYFGAISVKLYGKSHEFRKIGKISFEYINDHVILLREVIAWNPYEDTTLWKGTHENYEHNKENLFFVCYKGHVDHLLKLWRKADTTNLKRLSRNLKYMSALQMLSSCKL